MLRVNNLRILEGIFRHYIRDDTRAFWQAEAEVGEQLGGRGLGRGDNAQSKSVRTVPRRTGRITSTLFTPESCLTS